MLRDEHVWIGGGFTGIVEYLRKKSGGAWDLDRDLRGEGIDHDDDRDDRDDEEEGRPPPTAAPSYTWAESTAYTSLIRSRLGPLLDISLYVSEVNYTHVTRPEFSKKGMLPWPVQYYVPGEKRAQAWERCEEVLRRYGLGAADVDPNPLLDSPVAAGLAANSVGAGVVDMGGATGGGTGGGGISSMFHRKPSASTAGVVFKLHSLISKSLTPIAARLVAADDADPTTQGVYFFKQARPTSIDCLILGYLCLAIYPELPNPFLAEGILELDGQRGGRRVIAWTHEMRRKVFGSMPLDAGGIVNSTKNGAEENGSGGGILPWGTVERADLPWLTGFFVSTAAGYVESWLPSWARWKRGGGERSPPPPPKKVESEEEKERRGKHERAVRMDRAARVATVLAGVGGFVAFLVGSGFVSISIEGEEGEEVVLEGEGEGEEGVEGEV